jgi:hypothetical protein
MSRLLGLSRRELTVLTAVFVLTLPAVTPRIYASDEIQYFSYLRSLWFDHDVSFENEYRHFYDHDIGRGENFHATFLQLETDAGRRPNFGTIGSAILWAPFYAVGDIVSRLTDANADGYSQPYVAAVAYGSAFYGFAAVVLAAAIARLVIGFAAPRGPRAKAGQAAPRRNRIGFEVIAATLVWIGTPLLFYMYIAPPYAHACSAFAVALFLFVWLHVRRTWSMRGAIALGLCAALMAMVREQDVFFAVGPAVDFLITASRGVRLDLRAANGAVLRYAKTAAAGCVAFAVGYLPQLLAYNALNGYPGPTRLVVRKMLWHSPHALQVLGSPEHGFLLWTPLAIVAIAGLAALAWRGAGDRRRIGYLLLLMLALQVYVSGSVDSWTVAGAFGQRRFVAVTSLLTVGMALVLRDMPKGAPRVAIGTLIALCVWWNLALAAAFGTGLMNRQRLELARNAYDAFVTVPRMAPDLAIRYVTKRDSFYRQRE